MTHAGKSPADRRPPSPAHLQPGPGSPDAAALAEVRRIAQTARPWACVSVRACAHTCAGLGVCSPETRAGTSGRRASWWGHATGDEGSTGPSGVSVPRKTAEACVEGSAGLPTRPPPRAGSLLVQLDRPREALLADRTSA